MLTPKTLGSSLSTHPNFSRNFPFVILFWRMKKIHTSKCAMSLPLKKTLEVGACPFMLLRFAGSSSFLQPYFPQYLLKKQCSVHLSKTDCCIWGEPTFFVLKKALVLRISVFSSILLSSDFFCNRATFAPYVLLGIHENENLTQAYKSDTQAIRSSTHLLPCRPSICSHSTFSKIV